MKTMIIILLAMAGAVGLRGEDKKPDPWEAVRFLIGKWQGTASGQSGTGAVTRSYEFILNDQFIQEHNTSTFPAQQENRAGEVHRHLGIISNDRKRRTLVMRQFHQESFVNLYSLNRAASGAKVLIFESEHFENFDNSWKAKETYEILSKDEFIETFELAPPGKDFEVYSRNRFKRVP
jgi:hypothetical protein